VVGVCVCGEGGRVGFGGVFLPIYLFGFEVLSGWLLGVFWFGGCFCFYEVGSS